MKINLGALLTFAALGMDQTSSGVFSSRVKPLKENTTPKPIGSAPDELRKPLLTGRRGKVTRKQRKGQHD